MKMHLVFPCLVIVNTIFATSPEPEETNPLFQYDLTAYNTNNQPFHLRNALPEKEPSFTDMTILNLDLPSAMQVDDIAERILYGDADVVHMTNTSTQRASHLYEMLQKTYAHFIHIPKQKRGSFIASKYPLSQATVILSEEENIPNEEVLEFVIHGANRYKAYVRSNDVSRQTINLTNTDDDATTSILLVDLPGTLTVVKQRFSLFQSAPEKDLSSTEGVEILPIRRGGGGGGRDNDNGGRERICRGLDRF